jgi:hypothetical protein
MTFLKSHVLSAVFLVFCFGAHSQDITFDNISESDLKDIVQDFSGVFTHTSVSGAGSLGSIFGFELGLVGGASQVDRLEKIIKREDPTAEDIPMIPSGGLLGRLTVPFGLTIEALVIPEVGDEDFKFQNTSLALLWTPTETILSFMPVSIGTKLHYTTTDLNFQTPDPVTGTDVKGTFKNYILGLQALVSQDLVFVEPYAGIGYVQADGDLAISGSNTFYNFTTATSASKSVSGTQFLLGAEFKLLVMKFGAEYSHQFDVNRYSAKFSL